jgi:hypothetical protein
MPQTTHNRLAETLGPRTMISSVPPPRAALPPPPPPRREAAAPALEDQGYESDECCDHGPEESCLACPVTPERRSWWAEAVRQMDEMRAIHAAAPPPMPLEPRLPPDYARTSALFGSEVAATLLRVYEGQSLYDALYPDGDPEWDAYEEELMAKKAQREAVPEAVRRAEEERIKLAYLQRRIEEKVADESKARLNRDQLKSGVKLEKKDCPCARLYSCVGDKSTGGAKPTTRHISSECWSHERVCPETGARLKPHKCPWLHPGEPGWHTQWNTDRLWRPASAAPVAASRFAALSSAPAPSARVAATKAPWAKPQREDRSAW